MMMKHIEEIWTQTHTHTHTQTHGSHVITLFFHWFSDPYWIQSITHTHTRTHIEIHSISYMVHPIVIMANEEKNLNLKFFIHPSIFFSFQELRSKMKKNDGENCIQFFSLYMCFFLFFVHHFFFLFQIWDKY